MKRIGLKFSIFTAVNLVDRSVSYMHKQDHCGPVTVQQYMTPSEAKCSVEAFADRIPRIFNNIAIFVMFE